jgi:hypothetical protein
MGDEEGPKWPSLRRMHPNSTAGAPNGLFGFKTQGQSLGIDMGLRGETTGLRPIEHPAVTSRRGSL